MMSQLGLQTISLFFTIMDCEKLSTFYSDWPKSWIWRTLGHFRDIFCKCHIHNASKEVFQPKYFLNFMHEFKSAILPELKNCQKVWIQRSEKSQMFKVSWLFKRSWMSRGGMRFLMVLEVLEVLVHEIQNMFWSKDFFWSIMRMTFTKNISNMSQGLPNPGFRSFRVENWDFLKNNSHDFKNSFQF